MPGELLRHRTIRDSGIALFHPFSWSRDGNQGLPWDCLIHQAQEAVSRSLPGEVKIWTIVMGQGPLTPLPCRKCEGEFERGKMQTPLRPELLQPEGAEPEAT